MTNAIYLGGFGEERNSDLYSQLVKALSSYIPGMKFPKKLEHFFLFDDRYYERSKQCLEREISASDKEFLYDITVVFNPNTKSVRDKIDFVIDYSIGILTFSENEPQKIKDGSFASELVKKMMQDLPFRYCIVLMNDTNPDDWIYLRDR